MKQLTRRREARTSARRAARTWLRFEVLEDRTVPSTAMGDPLLNSMAMAAAGYKGTFADPVNKVGPELAGVYAEYTHSLTIGSPAAFHPSDSLLRIANGDVLVDAAASGTTAALAADLQSLGGQVTGTYGRLVSGYLPLGRISAFSTLSSLGLARPSEGQTNADPAVQGDQAMYADVARSNYGLTGSGVTVGVLSDSFNNSGNGSYQADLISGALPAGINVQEEESKVGTDEGRAMLQVVHAVAPSAGLAFHTGFNGEADFASGIQALATAGANVIVDDVTYYDETFFQDNAISQAANNVVQSGHAYFSSAGNEAQQSYEANFVAGNTYAAGTFFSASGAPKFFGGVAHNFNNLGGYSDQQTFSLQTGASLNLTFNWQQPNYSISGGSGAQVDMDIYILDSNNVVVAGDASYNIGGDAIARLGYTNTTGTIATYKVMIMEFSHVGSAVPGRLKYIDFTDGLPAMGNLAFATNSGTIIGHHNAEFVEAVGAANAANTPRYGVSPPQLEGFSSSGGVSILFDTFGNPENVVNVKPGVVAPDGVTTTLAGNLGNFTGTSCAAPDAAGVAALMLQAAGTSTSPFTIYADMQNTALNMGGPVLDYLTGYGLVQALPAVGDIYPDSSEPTLSQAQATGIVNTTPGGNFSTIAYLDGPAGPADVDMYSFQATVGSTLTASTVQPAGGTHVDTYIRLFDANGNQLAFDDDSNGNQYSIISNYQFAATGTYYLGVSAFPNDIYNPTNGFGTRNGNTQGDYQVNISVNAPADVGGTLGTAQNTGISTPGGSYAKTATIGDGPSGSADVDMYQFQATIDSKLTSVTSQPTGGVPEDTYMRLFDANGNQLAFNDDANGTQYSQINYTFGATGTYYVGISGWPNETYDPVTGYGAVSGRTGDYQLSLTVASPTATAFNLTAPATSTAGNPFSITVTAQDSNGNLAAGYLGIAHFINNNGQAILPPDYTFTASDAGSHTFTVTLKTAGSQIVTAVDTVTSAITGFAVVNDSPAAASHFSITDQGTTTAGGGFLITLTALDPYGNTATGYAGSVHFTSSDNQASLPANYTFIPNDSGSRTFLVTLKTAGAETVTATDTSASSITATTGVSVSAAAASHFNVTGPATSTAGSAFSITVTALDPYGNTDTGYGGIVHFTSSDGQALLPTDYTFTASDAGSHTFTVTLKTAGAETLTATDKYTSSITGSTGMTVSAMAASYFSINGPAGSRAGSAFSITLTALDPSGNTAASYRGTVHFTSSDGQASLPTNYTFTATDAGSHTFTVTLKTAGAQSVTATDTITSSITATTGVTVSAAAATRFSIVGPATSTAGTAFTITLTALDPYGNTGTGYAGIVHFSSSDNQATLPVNYTFTASDAGIHTFTITLKTAGAETVTATDTASSSITGVISVNITVPASSHFSIAAPATCTAGSAFSITVTAQDQSGNTASSYLGTVNFTSSDGQAIVPANYTFTATDAGIHTFTVTLKTAGARSVTATDTSTSSITGTAGVTVSAAAATQFGLAGPATCTAGNAITITVTALDPYGNSATSYAGMAHFKSSDNQASLPANYTFTPGDAGSHTFTVTLKTAGGQTVTATDSSTSSISGAEFVSVFAASATQLFLAAPSPVTAGNSFTLTVTAIDPYFNTDPSYSGTVHFTSSDSKATLPPDARLTNGAGSFTVTLRTAGNPTLTATDTLKPSITGSQGISVFTAAASHFSVKAPNNVTAGKVFNFTVTALDAFNNRVYGYLGTVHFTSTDTAGVLPSNYLFTSVDNGKHTFKVTLNTVGKQSITVADTVNLTIKATKKVTVVGAPGDHFQTSPPPPPAQWYGQETVPQRGQTVPQLGEYLDAVFLDRVQYTRADQTTTPLTNDTLTRLAQGILSLKRENLGNSDRSLTNDLTLLDSVFADMASF